RSMKKKSIIVLVVILVALIGAAVAVYLMSLPSDTTFEYTVKDIVSGEWVHDTTMKLQDRQIRGYFDKDYHFSNLKPGKAVLSISSPSYVAQEVPVSIKSGKNILDKPVEMVGYEIPTLDHFIMIEDDKDNELITEIRPVGTDGRAVVNHPSIDLRVLILVSAQLTDGNYSQTKTEKGSTRGEELYRGEITWNWDSDASAIFRYQAPVPVSKIKKSDASFWVIDYLTLAPDYRETSREEMDKVVQEVGKLSKPEEVTAYLDKYKGKLKYFLNESWNVAVM
ncbi:MAG TPA: hypothetical protein VMX75_06675, partial [Spirochaetia bacterium]|nr:hypothetical protein [Spirochaetia bacterium]